MRADGAEQIAACAGTGQVRRCPILDVQPHVDRRAERPEPGDDAEREPERQDDDDEGSPGAPVHPCGDVPPGEQVQQLADRTPRWNAQFVEVAVNRVPLARVQCAQQQLDEPGLDANHP